MKRRGLGEWSLSFGKRLRDLKTMRGRVRIVMLAGTAALMLWSSPTTAKPGAPAMRLAAPHVAISSITLLLENDNANGAVFGGLATGAGGFGVIGFASDTSSATNFGVAGATQSSTGTGVWGIALSSACADNPPQMLGATCFGVVGQSSAATGPTAGVLGVSSSTGDSVNGFSAYGVLGHNTDTTALSGSGVTIGTGGRSDAPGGIGVFGHETATTGENYGVVGRTESSGDPMTGNAAFGVFGRNANLTAPSGSELAMGVGGRSDAPGGVGVWGRASATSGQNFGVIGRTDSAGDAATQSFAFGVFGRAAAASGFTVGVQGRVDGIGDLTTLTPAIGVRGIALSTSGFTVGVRGDTFSPGDATMFSFPSIGVDGRARAASGFTIGVRGRITDVNGNPGGSPNGTGVVGDVTPPTCPTLTLTSSTVLGLGQTCVGVFGRSFATSGTTAGVIGTAQSNSPSAGVIGETTGSVSSGTTGTAGVVGISTATSGLTAGVIGQVNSPGGAAIVGNANNSGGAAGVFNGGPVSISCSSATNACLFVNNIQVAVPDLAEDMPVVRPVSPGDVVVLTRGQGYGIAPAARAYDTQVAGIVSTAPRVRFGIGLKKAVPVAMVGVVKAKASAVNGAIEFGDLLTTSPVAGHLMRCESALRCVGAIVGKALEPLPRGEQTILVLLWRQ